MNNMIKAILILLFSAWQTNIVVTLGMGHQFSGGGTSCNSGMYRYFGGDIITGVVQEFLMQT
jgi:hypothetical protein